MDILEESESIQDGEEVMSGRPGFREPKGLSRRLGKKNNKFPIPTGGPPQMKVSGEPMPFAVMCCGCNKTSQMPDFDPKYPPAGFICVYCKMKHRMKFNKNAHKWEITPVREEAGEKGVSITGDADRPTNTG